MVQLWVLILAWVVSIGSGGTENCSYAGLEGTGAGVIVVVGGVGVSGGFLGLWGELG